MTDDEGRAGRAGDVSSPQTHVPIDEVHVPTEEVVGTVAAAPPPLGSEDVIESEAPLARGTEIRRRLALLAPASMGRRVVAGIAAATLVLGLVAGFLVGSVYAPESTATLGLQAVPQPEGGFVGSFPEDPLFEEGVIVFTLEFEFLLPEDLLTVGETKVLQGPESQEVASGLDGLCGNASTPRPQPVPYPGLNRIASASFLLNGATLTERISPDLGVLAASTLRGTVELARTCASSEGLTVATDGLAVGIGDEYAVFSLSRLNPASGLVENSIVVLIRVADRLIEISMAPDGGFDIPDGLGRALRIAEVAVTRMLAG